MSNKQKIIDVMKEKQLYLRGDRKEIELISLVEIEQLNDKIGDIDIEIKRFKEFDIKKLGITYQQLYEMRYKLVEEAEENKLNIYFYYSDRGNPKSELLIVDGTTYFKSRGKRIKIDKMKKFKLDFNLDNFYKLFPEAKVTAKGTDISRFNEYLPFYYGQLKTSK